MARGKFGNVVDGVILRFKHALSGPASAPPRTCNRHDDCDAADAKARAQGRRVDHCHDDCCEDCFGQ